MRRASRGSRPVVLVALEAVSVVVPVDSVSNIFFIRRKNAGEYMSLILKVQMDL